MKKNLNYISYLRLGNIVEPLQSDNTIIAQQNPIESIQKAEGNYEILPYETPNNLYDLSYQQVKNKVTSDLKGKNKNEIKAIQQQIADAGYYDQFLHNLSKDQIIAIQKRMAAKNLYKGQFNGKLDQNTIAAYRQYNVDGIVGNRTLTGYKQIIAPDVNYSYGATCTPDKGCAQFVTHSYNRATEVAEQNGVVGNAWRMPMNIINSGGTELYNIYSDPRFKRNRNNLQAIRNLHNELLGKNKIDLSILHPGDVVGLYNPGSNYQETANREGTTFNSHVGLVVQIDSDGIPIIEHNLYGRVARERADKLGKRQIAVAVRPKFSGKIPTINWDLQKSDYIVDPKIDNDNLKMYRESMAGFVPILTKIFPNVPMDKMQELALGILGRETNFMNDLESTRTGLAGVKRDLEQWVRTNIFKESQISKSSDLTKTKFTTFTPEERQFIGINSTTDLNNPKIAGAAVLYLLSKNYNYLNNYQKTYPELGLTDEDKLNATIMSYNQGMSKNSPARSLGFDSETGVRNDEEIQNLRNHSDINQTVDSYSGTKYAKIDKFLSPLNIKPGRFLYNTFGKDREGYAATARNNIKKYIKKGRTGGKLNYLDFFQ